MTTGNAILMQETPDYARKVREGRGSNKFPYVGWEYAASVLIAATQNNYDFKILRSEIINVDSTPLMEYDKSIGKKVQKMDAAGEPMFVPQPPVLVVYGELTLYDPKTGDSWGTRSNYGSAVLEGPSSQWGDMHKSAASDCLKKCAQLFGVALDMAGDLYIPEEEEEEPTFTTDSGLYSVEMIAVKDNPDATDFEENDISLLQDLLASLGIESPVCDAMVTVIEDYSGAQLHEFADITPINIKSFNAFLESLLTQGTA